MLPNMQRCMALFGGSQASPVCPSDKSSINMKINVGIWWYDNNSKIQSTQRQTCPSVSIHHKSQIDRPKIKPGLLPVMKHMSRTFDHYN